MRRFGTMTRELLRLLEWLQRERVRVLAMESTGSYWKPVYNLLEGQGMELMLVNPAHMKAVPGRKTDVKDAQWIADLLRHGLLTASRVPERPQRELQGAMRYRQRLIEDRADEVRRLQKVLEGGNIKLGDVATDVLGKSGRMMLEQLASGETDSDQMAGLAQGKLRTKRASLSLALEGSVGPHQRFMLKRLLEHIEFLEGEIDAVSQEIEARMRPLSRCSPGSSRSLASADATRNGSWPRSVLTCATGATTRPSPPGPSSAPATTNRRASDDRAGSEPATSSCVARWWKPRRQRHGRRTGTAPALYHRLKAKRGAKRALIAVAHAILVTIYHLLKDGTYYQDLGADHFDRRDREALVRRNVRRLELLGYHVSLSPAA